MILVIFTSLFSYMFFFSIVVAPTISINLDEENRTVLLRKIFPKNFLFGLILSLLGFLFCFYENQLNGAILLFLIGIFFLVNLFILIPKINFASDQIKSGKKDFLKIFKKLHLFSVILYSIQMLLSISGIYIFF